MGTVGVKCLQSRKTDANISMQMINKEAMEPRWNDCDDGW